MDEMMGEAASSSRIQPLHQLPYKTPWAKANGKGRQLVPHSRNDDDFPSPETSIAGSRHRPGIHRSQSKKPGVLHVGGSGKPRDRRAGCQAGHRDATTDQFLCQRLGEGQDVGFAGKVHGHSGAGLEACDGTDVENAASASFDYSRQKESSQMRQGSDVDLEHVQLSLKGQVGHRTE
jgi:hypothetical protein